MSDCPYNFPATTREEQLAALAAMSNPYHDGRRRYPFSWNVKLDFMWPMTAKELAPYTDEGLNPDYDSDWVQHVEDNPNFSYWVMEDMQQEAQEYCTWPGNDQGAFKFHFCGRSGGHMCLAEMDGLGMTGYLEDWAEDIIAGHDDRIRRVYRALVCMTADFTRDKLREELAYQIAWRRQQWEDERRDEQARANAAFAAALEASRPDMYGEDEK